MESWLAETSYPLKVGGRADLSRNSRKIYVVIYISYNIAHKDELKGYDDTLLGIHSANEWFLNQKGNRKWGDYVTTRWWSNIFHFSIPPFQAYSPNKWCICVQFSMRGSYVIGCCIHTEDLTSPNLVLCVLSFFWWDLCNKFIDSLLHWFCFVSSCRLISGEPLSLDLVTPELTSDIVHVAYRQASQTVVQYFLDFGFTNPFQTVQEAQSLLLGLFGRNSNFIFWTF